MDKVTGILIGFVIGGFFTLGFFAFSDILDTAKSNKKIIPTYQLQVSNNKIDTIWVYRSNR